ncbi:hypothetical protein D047_4568B, partial [Vibrio parahaemolyticus VPTS-2010_2]
TLFLY